MKKENHLQYIGIEFLFYFFRIIPVKKSKVVFCNYVGKGYGCNPKYIAEEIIKRKKNWKLVWLTHYPEAVFPKEIKSVKYESMRAIYELATAGIWVDNQRKLPHYRKRKSQCFIETWHGGGGPMKKIGADNPRNFNNKPYERTSKHMDKIVNVMVSNSSCCTAIYRSAFLYTGEILECGYPRNDILLQENDCAREKMYDYFRISMEKRTLLYAPTYRNNRNLEQYTLDMAGLRAALAKRFGGSWIILLRLHPSMLSKAQEVIYNEYVLNASGYDDIQELLSGADILVSDYSSVISEFALTGKPIFLYATDVSEYAMERDFYSDYWSLPFPIARDNDELIKNVINFSEGTYRENVKEYLESVGMAEKGNASKIVVDYMEGWVQSKNRKKNSSGTKNLCGIGGLL